MLRPALALPRGDPRSAASCSSARSCSRRSRSRGRSGRDELGALRYAWRRGRASAPRSSELLGGLRFAWAAGERAPQPALALRRPGRGSPRPSSRASSCCTSCPIWLVRYFPTQDGPLHVENVLALLRHAGSPLLQHWYVAELGRAAELAHAGDPRRAPAVGGAARGREARPHRLHGPLPARASGRVLPRGTRRLVGGARSRSRSCTPSRSTWASGTSATGSRSRSSRSGSACGRAAGSGPARFARARGALGAPLPRALRRARGGRRRDGRPSSPGVSRSRCRARAGTPRAGASCSAATPCARRPRPSRRCRGPSLLAHLDRSRTADRVSSRIPFLELAAKLAAGVRARLDRPARALPRLRGDARDVRRRSVHLAARARRPRRRALRPHDGWLLAAVAFAILYFAVPDVVAAGAHVSDRFALVRARLRDAPGSATGAAPAHRVRRIARRPRGDRGRGARGPLREAARALRPTSRSSSRRKARSSRGPRAPAARGLAARAARRRRAAASATA